MKRGKRVRKYGEMGLPIWDAVGSFKDTGNFYNQLFPLNQKLSESFLAESLQAVQVNYVRRKEEKRERASFIIFLPSWLEGSKPVLLLLKVHTRGEQKRRAPELHNSGGLMACTTDVLTAVVPKIHF